MELESIYNLLVALVVFEAVKMGILFFAGYYWLITKDYYEQNEKK